MDQPGKIIVTLDGDALRSLHVYMPEVETQILNIFVINFAIASIVVSWILEFLNLTSDKKKNLDLEWINE